MVLSPIIYYNLYFVNVRQIVQSPLQDSNRGDRIKSEVLSVLDRNNSTKPSKSLPKTLTLIERIKF